MKYRILVPTIMACAFAGSVAAQDCAVQTQILSNSTVTADTCTSGNQLPNMGGTPSAPNDFIYYYDSMGVTATSIEVQSSVAGAAVYLLPSCTNTNPTDFGFVGTPLTLDAANSPDGSRMYLNVTFDGSLPASTCGSVTLVVDGTLPVELNSFSID